MKFKKLLKKYYKLIIIIFIVVLIFILSLFIYKNIFAGSASDRLENVENYKLTKKEINSAKDKINEIDNVNNIEIYTNYKIIKIFLELKEDVDFENIKEMSNELIECFSKENIEFYDLEIFINSDNKGSEIYPKIGYKHKTNSEFTWNR